MVPERSTKHVDRKDLEVKQISEDVPAQKSVIGAWQLWELIEHRGQEVRRRDNDAYTDQDEK